MEALVNDLAVLMVFLLIGFALRELIKPLQKLFLPAGLIGGTLALLCGPQALGLVSLPESWSGMATPMINIILTCAVFGTVISKAKIKSYVGSINIIVLTYFAQLAVGGMAGWALAKIWTGLNDVWGVMASFTYWGGHGAGASAGQLFEDLGVADMRSMGIVMATLGMIIAMAVGMMLVNVGVRRGWAENVSNLTSTKIKTRSGPLPLEKQKSLGNATVSPDAVNGLAMQLALVLLCIWLGSLIFGFIKSLIPAASSIPSLLYGIVGAFVIWFLMRKIHIDGYVDKRGVESISGCALEICICSATATLDLEFFATYLVPILIHMVIIVALQIFCCVYLIRRWFKNGWFESCLLFFGMGTGSTPSGLALERCVDPEMKNSSALEGFGISVGVFSPISSTLAAILPVLAVQSFWFTIGLGVGITLVCVIFGEAVLLRNKNS